MQRCQLRSNNTQGAYYCSMVIWYYRWQHHRRPAWGGGGRGARAVAGGGGPASWRRNTLLKLKLKLSNKSRLSNFEGPSQI